MDGVCSYDKITDGKYRNFTLTYPNAQGNVDLHSIFGHPVYLVSGVDVATPDRLDEGEHLAYAQDRAEGRTLTHGGEAPVAGYTGICIGKSDIIKCFTVEMGFEQAISFIRITNNL